MSVTSRRARSTLRANRWAARRWLANTGHHHLADFLDVLADSTAPMEGAWHLGQKMEEALTMPQIVSGRRACSYRATGEVLDSAIADEIAAGWVDPNFRHVIAFLR